MTSTDSYQKARRLIDAAHQEDPLYKSRQAGSSTSVDAGDTSESSPDEEGEESKQDEMEYADAMEAWAIKLIESAPDQSKVDTIKGGKEILRLAARCQHLERFKTPRKTYPEGKAGYLKWRRDLYRIQADRAMQLLKEAGVDEEECENVGIWVSKTDLKPGKEGGIWGTQVRRSDQAGVHESVLSLLRTRCETSSWKMRRYSSSYRISWSNLQPDIPATPGRSLSTS